MTGIVKSYAHEHGGRVVLLFLLFLLAIYNFITSGLNSYAIICLTPLFIGFAFLTFKYKYIAFWSLIIVNYFIHFWGRHQLLPNSIPTSAYNEIFEILLIAIVIIDIRKEWHFRRVINLMSFAVLLWTILCIIEVFNNTCGLGINVAGWFTAFRLMAFQLVYYVVIFSLFINSPQTLRQYMWGWAGLALFSVYWSWQQQYIGFTQAEHAWLYSGGPSKHLVNGIVRYWSTFSDAANYGCNAGASSVAFMLFGLTSKLTKDKIFFTFVGFAVLWGMFSSGTRTAIACFFAGLLVYIFLSKSVKMAIPIILLGAISFILLVFTNIGQGNNQIRRMRSAFGKNDASANVRDINKETMSKYMKDAPWGIGMGIGNGDVPARNKYVVMSYIAPDSEYVFMWIHTGIIGVTVFAISMFLMFVGACWTVLFRLRNKSLIGIGAGFCCAFAAIQLGAYANQVLFQYPNGLIFFGGLAIVYVLPFIEKDWEIYEQNIVSKQEEKKRIKLEKKLASRV